MKEKIVEILQNEYDALDLYSISDKMGISSSEDLERLQNYLYELVDELVVYQTKKNKYILYEKCPNFKKGIIQIKDSGNAFLLQDDDDIFVSKRNIGFSLDSDYVLVEVIKSKTKTEKAEGRVIKVLKRGDKNIVGMILYQKENSKLILKNIFAIKMMLMRIF